MNTLTTRLIFLAIPLAFLGCSETETGSNTAPVTVRVEEKKPKEKEPCKHGDFYPFDKCGKHYLRPQPLEALPREIPNIVMNTPLSDLSLISDLAEKLAGEWIGKPYITSSDRIRFHWLFRPDQTFVASVFENTYAKSESIQLFDTISGTFSQKDGMLFLQLSEKLNPVSFPHLCDGYSWEEGSEGLVLKIPIAFHENGKTLTLHRNNANLWVVNVLVKKAS